MPQPHVPDIPEWFDLYRYVLDLIRKGREWGLDAADDAERRGCEQFRRLMWRRAGDGRLARGLLRQAAQFFPPPELIFVRAGRAVVGVDGARLLTDAKFVVSDKLADVLLRIDGGEYPVVDIRTRFPALVQPPAAPQSIPEPAAGVDYSLP